MAGIASGTVDDATQKMIDKWKAMNEAGLLNPKDDKGK